MRHAAKRCMLCGSKTDVGAREHCLLVARMLSEIPGGITK
jgi:phosphoribosyl-dephospho-CoA transferase